MNGRNFLDLALLIPGVSPTNIGSTQLFRGNVRGARSGHLDRAASATSPTTSSSMGCRRTTTPRDSAGFRTASMPSTNFRSSRQADRRNSDARSAATSTS